METTSQSEQKENLTKDQMENQTTEVITAEFDTLDSKPILKKLRIERTISDRTLHAEKQSDIRLSKTEVKDEKYKAKGESDTEIHSVKKSKPARGFGGWLIAGGIAIVLLLLFGVWKKIK